MLNLFRNKEIKSRIQQCFCLCTGLFIFIPVFPQFRVTVHLNVLPASHGTDPIFIAGNFNGWNPGDTNYQFTKKDSAAVIELKELPAGAYEFKFTRGSWSKVETAAGGTDISNHTVKLAGDTALYYSIVGWADDFIPLPKAHTASANVHILDTAFEMPQLNRHRRIWIYLPPSYSSGKKNYPVMYMQDGQNIFDEYTSAYGEWGIDECLDSLIARGRPSCIVVGIDNGGEKRMNEYNPYGFTWKDSTTSKTFSPEGDDYLSFVANTLKPFIDKYYRTLASRENTIIAGSSMGGLIAYYALLKYPKVFGNAGIFSPAFWTASGIDNITDSVARKLDAKLFFYMGDAEGEELTEGMNRIVEKIGQRSSALVLSVIDPEGIHSEAAWRKWFPEFYKWIMADGFNVITNSRN
jgi:predicted alpha/beta superfamily hydrolase